MVVHFAPPFELGFLCQICVIFWRLCRYDLLFSMVFGLNIRINKGKSSVINVKMTDKNKNVNYYDEERKIKMVIGHD